MVKMDGGVRSDGGKSMSIPGGVRCSRTTFVNPRRCKNQASKRPRLCKPSRHFNLYRCMLGYLRPIKTLASANPRVHSSRKLSITLNPSTV